MKKKFIIYIGFFALLFTLFLAFVFWDYDFSKSKLKVINATIPEFSFKDQMEKLLPKAMWMVKCMLQNISLPHAKAFAPK